MAEIGGSTTVEKVQLGQAVREFSDQCSTTELPRQEI